jgi:hypothetical protein
VIIANLKPKPSSPMRFDFGTLHSSKANEAVSEARMPSFFSFLATERPGVPFSTTNVLIPSQG